MRYNVKSISIGFYMFVLACGGPGTKYYNLFFCTEVRELQAFALVELFIARIITARPQLVPTMFR